MFRLISEIFEPPPRLGVLCIAPLPYRQFCGGVDDPARDPGLRAVAGVRPKSLEAAVRKSKRFLAMGVAFAMSIATVTGLASTAQAVVGPVGAGFTVTAGDLSFILKQIKIAERHASTLD